MKGIKSISIIGTGNVAFHLGNSFFTRGIKINQVYGRNPAQATELSLAWKCKTETQFKELNADLILICVSDDAIESIVSQIPSHLPVAYTSGAKDLHSFSGNREIGVFYPLQTFSKDSEINIFEVPFLIEANSEYFAQDLFDLAWVLSRKVFFANSTDRLNYHLAAVWVNNFTNHMVYQAKKHLDESQLDWKMLLPLLKETVLKLATLSPSEAQTGPAKRNDTQTIENHLKHLSGTPKELYALISKSIIESNQKND